MKLIPRSQNKRAVLIGAVLGVCILVIAAVFMMTKTTPSALHNSGPNSLTLYYRDGKTVLWESNKNGDWLHEQMPSSVGLAIDELEKKFGSSALRSGEWRVTTTLDPSLQKAAEETMSKSEQQIKRQKGKNAALIAEDVTNGQVVAVVGKMSDATDDAVAQKLEVGTLALPLSYAAVMNADPAVTANTTYVDSMDKLPGYACTNRSMNFAGNCLYNFDAKFLGPVSVRQALGGLRLVPVVRASMQISINDLRSFTNALTTDGKFTCYRDEQLSEETQCYTASVFGDGLFAKPKDMIQAYATLANGGKKFAQTSVLKAVQDGKTQYEWRQSAGEQAMKPEVASTITGILSDPSVSSIKTKDYFTISGTKVGVVMGIEGGSTMDSVVQYSPKYAVGVWAVGDAQGMVGFAETAVLPPASAWMKAAH